jgi:amino acid adenylation domain-containing protein
VNIHHANLDTTGLNHRQDEASALRRGSISLTYQQLAAQGAALAGALSAAGVGAGDVVAVCLPRSIAHVVALVAARHSGAAYLPLDPDWPEARLATLLTRSGAKVLIAPAAAAAFAGRTPVIDPAAVGPSLSPAAHASDDLAYVIYTSGSSGEPKAVEVTHGNLAALVDWHVGAFGLDAGTRSSWLAGLAFDASAWEIWPVLASGGTLVIPDDETLRYDALRLTDWLVAQRIEVAFVPTAIAEQLIAQAWPQDTALRMLLTGADRLRTRPRPGLPFALINNYGPTECTVVATSGEVSPHGEGLPAIGAPLPGVQVRLLDGTGEPVAEGEPGEIWIGGAQVARGYRGDPALTATHFVSHPRWGRLYRTGDLARRDAQGQLHFLGRSDGQIKVRGHRIEPAEIEAALIAIDGVAAAAVAVRDDDLTAWVVGHGLTSSRLRAALATRLPAPMIPARFAQIDALPLNRNGKLDRHALPDPLNSVLAERYSVRRPETPTQARFAAIIAETIGRDDFGVDDDFFLLGGHSLLGTQVIVKAREAFGVELTLLHLFEARTVARLSAVVEDLALAHLASLSDADIARLIDS